MRYSVLLGAILEHEALVFHGGCTYCASDALVLVMTLLRVKGINLQVLSLASLGLPGRFICARLSGQNCVFALVKLFSAKNMAKACMVLGKWGAPN